MTEGSEKMLTTSEMRLRLENEYHAMCAFPVNSLFTWRIAPGQTVPRVKSYIITYNIRTKVRDGGRERFQEKTTVRIDYPEDINNAPIVNIIEGKVPFVPNWWENGRLCPGNMWEKDKRLWMFVIKVGKVLAMDPAYTNPDSPANHIAASDWKDKERKHLINKLYPCGRTDFPHPAGY